MYKLLLVFTFLFFSVSLKSKSVIGKWRVIAANNGVYYNYKTDSFSVTKQFLNSLVGRKDSAETIEMFESFANRYPNYYFIFVNDGKYQEIRNGEVRIFGTFKVNLSNQNIEATYGNEGKQHPANFRFKFEKGNLRLIVHSDFMEDDLELTLEKL